MVSGPEDDFANFLDFGDLSFSNFSDNGAGTPQANGVSPGLQHGDAGPMDMSMEGAASAAGLMAHSGATQQDAIPHAMNGFQEPFPDMTSPAEYMSRQHSQQHMQMQQHPRYYGHNAVPPTPNSLEMHGAHPEYYNPADRQQQLMYEHYRRHQNEQVRGLGIGDLYYERAD